MDYSNALRWAGLYQTLASAAFLLGAAVAGVGVYVGAPGAVDALSGPGSVTTALLDGNVLVVGAGVAVGTLVWRLGATVAYVRTMTAATESELAERFDTQHVKSDILSVLDDRLADMHTELEETRRSVETIKRDQKAGNFDDFEE